MKTLTFGTDGIRGNARRFPFTSSALPTLAQAITQWMKKKYEKHNLRVLIAQDTRESGTRIKQQLFRAFNHDKIECYDLGIAPTPAVPYLARIHLCDIGIMISASHNPYTDNGIKLFDAQLGKLTKEDETSICEIFNRLYEKKARIQPSIKELAEYQPIEIDDYLLFIASIFKPNFLKKIKIVLDCAHGATSYIAPKLFESFGAEVITCGTASNGKNINHQCGVLALKQLQQTVLQNKADIGFAFDGDGDRVIMINAQGEICDGDDILAILLTHPHYKSIDHVVGTVMTNVGFELYLAKQHKKLIRTNVGDKFVLERLGQEKLSLGGETSGHIIMMDYLPTGDGIFTALRALEALIYSQQWSGHLFTKYPQLIINVPIQEKKDLSQPPYATIINKHKQQIEPGRIIVRYSGTENLLRIMAEACEYTTTQATAQSLACSLEKLLV